MKTKFRVNVTFYQYITFHKQDKDEESKRIYKGLVTEYKRFSKIVEKNITKQKFGPLKGISVDVGDDDDLYPDSTQVEYWFGFDYTCENGEDEIIEDYDGNAVLRLSEDATQKIKSRIERILHADYCPDLIMSAEELHSFKRPNVVIHKPLNFPDSQQQSS